MAFQHGAVDVTVSIDVSGSPVDISGYLESFNADFSRELVDIKVMGDTWVSRLNGIRMCDCSGEAVFDPTIDAALYAAWNGNAAITWSYVIDTVTYSGECRIPTYSVNASSTDAVRQPFTLVSDGAVTRT